ncbi:MAG: hypothetical protein MR308_03435 [Lachnospiraceae bacterium]|nr:hypothetical protein [Lachnospiraceae bacterium]
MKKQLLIAAITSALMMTALIFGRSLREILVTVLCAALLLMKVSDKNREDGGGGE